MSAHEKKPKKHVIVVITGSSASIDDVHLSSKRKDTVRWTGTDEAYELWFLDADWPFGAPDATATGYKIIHVPFGDSTKKWSLEYDLAAGAAAREHEYQIRRAAAATVPGPPEGPSVWGEG